MLFGVSVLCLNFIDYSVVYYYYSDCISQLSCLKRSKCVMIKLILIGRFCEFDRKDLLFIGCILSLYNILITQLI